MIKPKLTWQGDAIDKYLLIGGEYFGVCGISRLGKKYFAAKIGRYPQTEYFESEAEAVAKLEKWAHEFFKSIIEGATDA